MRRFIQTCWQNAGTAVFLAVLIGAGLSLTAHAANRDRVAVSGRQATESGVEASAQPQHGQLARESREAAGEDDQDQFKKSASVKLVAKVTGLSLEHAYWLCILFNFAVVAYAVVWAAKKNLPGIFRDRTALIQQSMREARRASEDANRRLADVESRLSQLSAKIAEMTAAGEKEAADEEERIKAAAEEDARRIVASAEHEIEAAAKSARRDLTAFAADLAVSLATKQIHVDDATDRALVGGFAQQLPGNGADTRKGRQ